MDIIKTELPGVLIVEPKVFGDVRGHFFESWNQATFEAAGITNKWVQDNESESCFGVLRGLHCQAAPYMQASFIHAMMSLADGMRPMLKVVADQHANPTSTDTVARQHRNILANSQLIAPSHLRRRSHMVTPDSVYEGRYVPAKTS